MGLQIKSLATQVAALGFNLASDIVKSCSYIQPTSAAYDPAAGTVTPTNATKSVSAMILQFSQKEVDGQIVKLGDERVLIQCSDLSGLTPGTDDTITVSGIVRRVIGFTKDATGTIYTFHCRREVPA